MQLKEKAKNWERIFAIYIAQKMRIQNITTTKPKPKAVQNNSSQTNNSIKTQVKIQTGNTHEYT